MILVTSNSTRLWLVLSAIAVSIWTLTRLISPHSSGPPSTADKLRQIVPHIKIPSQGFDLVPSSDVADYCSRYRLEPYSKGDVKKRKVYDLLLVNTELEMLQVRLGEMYAHVDYFVIIESDITFTDKAKPLYMREAWDLFRPYHDKIILRSMDHSELNVNSTTWDRERLSRNSMYSQVVPFLKDEQAPAYGDVLLVSDVDEIPKAEILRALRNCDVPDRTTLRSHMYYYSFEYRSRENWAHPQATTFCGKDTIQPNDLRMGETGHDMQHAAWHCSYCFSTIAEMVKKVTSFSHSELDKPEFKDPHKILDRVRYGKDFFDRESEHFDYVENNHDIPSFLKHNREYFGFMVDRSAESGNFNDYVEMVKNAPKPKEEKKKHKEEEEPKQNEDSEDADGEDEST